MPGPDDILRKVTNSIEDFTKRVGQIADLFLDYISRIIKSIIDFFVTAAQKIYRFAKEILINTIKLLWAFLKILLFFLAPTYTLFFGLEILSSESALYYRLIGWVLLCGGSIGILLFTLAFLASFAKSTEAEGPTTRKVAKSGVLLIVLDIIAVGLITVSVVSLPNRHFQWWLLRETEHIIRMIVYYNNPPDRQVIASNPPDRQVIAEILRVRNNADESVEFNLSATQNVRVYCVGEILMQRYDYGWIENSQTGGIVWEMKESETTPAGGDNKNRKADIRITLQAGKYRLRYKSDNSHSFGNWNVAPPNDNFWGIVIYKAEGGSN